MYTKGLPEYHMKNFVFKNLLAKVCPNIVAHFKRIGVDTEIATT